MCVGVCRCVCVCACHTLMLEDSLWELELSSIVCVLGIKLRVVRLVRSGFPEPPSQASSLCLYLCLCTAVVLGIVWGWLDGACLHRGLCLHPPSAQNSCYSVLCWRKLATWRLLDYAGGVKMESQNHVKLSICFVFLGVYPTEVSLRKEVL